MSQEKKWSFYNTDEMQKLNSMVYRVFSRNAKTLFVPSFITLLLEYRIIVDNSVLYYYIYLVFFFWRSAAIVYNFLNLRIS